MLEAEIAKAQGDFSVSAQLQKKEFMDQEAKVYLQVYSEVEKAVEQFGDNFKLNPVGTGPFAFFTTSRSWPKSTTRHDCRAPNSSLRPSSSRPLHQRRASSPAVRSAPSSRRGARVTRQHSSRSRSTTRKQQPCAASSSR